MELEMELLKVNINNSYHVYHENRSENIIMSDIDGNVEVLGDVTVHLDKENYPFIADKDELLDELDSIRNRLCEAFGGNWSCGKLSALELAEIVVKKVLEQGELRLNCFTKKAHYK